MSGNSIPGGPPHTDARGRQFYITLSPVPASAPVGDQIDPNG